MLYAPSARQRVRTINKPIAQLNDADVAALFDSLESPGIAELIADGAARTGIVVARSVDQRYRGQSFTLSESWSSCAGVVEAFNAQHRSRYGHALNVAVE